MLNSKICLKSNDYENKLSHAILVYVVLKATHSMPLKTLYLLELLLGATSSFAQLDFKLEKF